MSKKKTSTQKKLSLENLDLLIPTSNTNNMGLLNTTDSNAHPIDCTHPNCPNGDLYACPSFISTKCPAREPVNFTLGEMEMGNGDFPTLWYPAPRAHCLEVIDIKRRVLSDFFRNNGFAIKSESIFTDASRYPYIYVRITVDGIDSFKRGATFEISIQKNNHQIWSVGVPMYSHRYERNSIVINQSSITIISKQGRATRYPVDYSLNGVSIPCEFLPHKALFMRDACRLCDFYKKGTQIPRRSFKKMLALCQETPQFIF